MHGVTSVSPSTTLLHQHFGVGSVLRSVSESLFADGGGAPPPGAAPPGHQPYGLKATEPDEALRAGRIKPPASATRARHTMIFFILILLLRVTGIDYETMIMRYVLKSTVSLQDIEFF